MFSSRNDFSCLLPEWTRFTAAGFRETPSTQSARRLEVRWAAICFAVTSSASQLSLSIPLRGLLVFGITVSEHLLPLRLTQTLRRDGANPISGSICMLSFFFCTKCIEISTYNLFTRPPKPVPHLRILCPRMSLFLYSPLSRHKV